MERSAVQGERSIGFARAGSFLLMPLGILLAGLGVLCLKGYAIGAAGKVLEPAVLPYLLVCLAEALILQFLLWRKKYDLCKSHEFGGFFYFYTVYCYSLGL